MRRIRPVLFIAILAAAFLAAGHRSWLSREVVVSVGLKASRHVPCQIFYTHEKSAPFAPGETVTVFAGPRGNPVRVSLPVGRLEGLRFDFGVAPGTVRAGPVTVEGRETRTLDWREFRVRHDVRRFDVDAGGAVNVESAGCDPYAIRPEPLDVPGRLRVNAFVLAMLVLLGAFAGLALAALPAACLRFASASPKERIRTAAFLLAALALLLARSALSAGLPPFSSGSTWDDVWFVDAASHLMRGEWLGPYDARTLCKGCFGPMVAAASASAGIPFLFLETVLYAFGCVFFLFVVSQFAQNRLFLLAAFALLLFNPLSWALLTFQRLYRNGMPLWQVPLLFGGFFLAYLRARGPVRRLLPWSLFSGIGLWAFQNTREDGVWFWPFALVCMAVSAVRAWSAGASRRDRAVRTFVCFAPLLVLLAGNTAVCLANRRAYGVPIRNDRNAGGYADAMCDLYRIEPDPADEARLSSPEHAGHYHSIYYSTVCKAYEASPTLRSARRAIDAKMDAWSRARGYHGRDLYLDHMLFAIREGVADAGHYASLPQSEAFWRAVHGELSAAFSDGRLRRRGLSVTALAAPFRVSCLPAFFREWRGTLSNLAVIPGVESKYVRPGGAKTSFAPDSRRAVFERIAACPAPDESLRPAFQPLIDRANRCSGGVRLLMPFVLAFAMAGYGFATVLVLRRRLRAAWLLDGWLLATGMLGSVLLHTACIAYMSATTFWASDYCYLTASHQLVLLFAVTAAGLLVRGAEERKRRSKGEDDE